MTLANVAIGTFSDTQQSKSVTALPYVITTRPALQSDIENFGLPSPSFFHLDPPSKYTRKVNSGSAVLMPGFVKTVHAYVEPEIELQDVE